MGYEWVNDDNLTLFGWAAPGYQVSKLHIPNNYQENNGEHGRMCASAGKPSWPQQLAKVGDKNNHNETHCYWDSGSVC